jgi:hypothetical protein
LLSGCAEVPGNADDLPIAVMNGLDRAVAGNGAA